MLGGWYYAALLSGEHPSAELLFRSGSCGTMQDMLRFQPAAVRLIRSSIILAELRAEIRYFHKFRQYPWRLAVIGDLDPMVTPLVKFREALAFVCADKKRLDKGFSRVLQRLTGTDRSLLHISGVLSLFWQSIIRLWVQQVDEMLDTHDLEVGHGQLKNVTNHLNKWELVAARAVNRAARRAFAIAKQDRDLTIRRRAMRGEP
jgi:hypothetical protein